jgi:hypothetical protein
MRVRRVAAAAWIGAALLQVAGCNLELTEEHQPRHTLFVGIDASGSFKRSGYYESSLSFLANYIYGHLEEMGGLAKPKALFVGSVGGKTHGEPKTFHPIHDFEGRSLKQIESDLHEWFRPNDVLTDFNAFFSEVARITKERNLLLSPITIMLVTDGIPDSAELEEGSKELYQQIDLKPLEYLSRNLTIRLAYVDPVVGKKWRTLVPRQRVRVWTVEGEVMERWPEHMDDGVALAEQERFWTWLEDNVNFPIRATSVY